MKVNIKVQSTDTLSDEELIEAILKARGVRDIENFLNPSVDDVLPFDSFLNIEKASGKIIDCIKNHKRVYVNADSDTDGVMSGAIMIRWLKSQGLEVDHHINLGKTHGTDDLLLTDLEEKRPDLLIMVDSLDGSLENYRYIKEELGIDIIVLDHHDVDDIEVFAPYITLVTSNYKYGNPELSGAGVVWKFCYYVDDLLGTCDADDLVDMAAVGILADVMDATVPENRSIIHEGIKNPVNPALIRICKGFGFNSGSVLYSVAPLINAACRYMRNEEALELFLTDDDKEIKTLYKSLTKCKEQQKRDIEHFMPDLEKQIENQKNETVLFLQCETEFGIKGLIANQIANNHKKPTIIVGSEVDDKTGKKKFSGSARCPLDIDFRTFCDATGLCFARGHGQAFGFSIEENKIEPFLKAIRNSINVDSSEKQIEVDAEIDKDRLTSDFIRHIKYINRITGKNFKPIKFLVKSKTFKAGVMTDGKHLSCEEKDGFRYIRWNSGHLYKDFCWYELNNNTVSFIGSLDSSYFGRNFVRRLIIDEFLIDE